MRSHVLLIGCQIVLLGCGSSGNSVMEPAHESGLLQDQSIVIGNEIRSYHLYLPENPSSASIVFLLHGNGGSSDQILGVSGSKAPYKVWMDVALRENLILVVPDGTLGANGKQGWNDCRVDASGTPDSDDVHFIGNLLNRIESDYSAGKPAVYAMGTSNGGLMVQRLADELPEKWTGIAFVVASKPVNSECAISSEPLSVLVMNGTSDPLLPYEGGQIASDRGEVLSTVQTVDYWVERNNADLLPVETAISDSDQDDDSVIRHYSYNNGENGNSVQFYEVVNGGHTEPSIKERYGTIFKLIVGNQNGDLEMAEEVWSFFKSL